jgi:hypothetical protein
MTAITIGKYIGEGRAADLDVERLVASRLLATASSGAGKSWLLRKILEEVSAKTQTIVIDVEGEFGSLREIRDMVLAGPAGEVTAELRSASLLCRRIMELNLSAVIDVSELKRTDRREYVATFCNTLVDMPRKYWRPCFVAIDETHEFAPEGERSSSTDAVAMLVSKGRKRGYCLIGATQRLAKLSKDVAAELRNQFVGQMNLDVDLKRAADVLGFPKERWPEIRDLHAGEFFVFGPALNTKQVHKVFAGQVKSTHPRPGQGRIAKPPAPSAKIKSVLGELADLAAKADEEAKTLAEKEQLIRELQRQLKTAGSGQVDQAALQRTIADEVERREAGWKQALADANGVIEQQRTMIEAAGKALSKPVALHADPPNAFRFVGTRKPIAIHSKPVAVAVTQTPSAGNGDLAKGAREILKAIASQDECSSSEITLLTGYKKTSKGEYLRQLKAAGYVEGSDPYTATAAGIAALGSDFRPIPTSGPSLRDHWLQKLSGGELEFLKELITRYPSSVDPNELGEAVGYKKTSRGEYLRKLRARKLIVDTRDGVKASDKLF